VSFIKSDDAPTIRVRRQSHMGIRRWALRIAVLAALVVGLPVMPAEGATVATGAATNLIPLHPPAANLGWFGSIVAISGNTAVVVAIKTFVPVGGGSLEEEQGQAFIYTSNGQSWSSTPVATLTAPAASGQFGTAVAISATTIVISDPNASPESAYIYSKGSDGWPTTPTVTETDPAWYPSDPLNDAFGESLAISGNTLLVGSANLNGDGVVYEYTEGSDGWPTTPTQTLDDPGASPTDATYDGFGEDVAVSGTTAMIGAYGAGGDGKPLVYGYTEGSDGWPTTATQTLTDPMSSDQCFGQLGLSISGTTALIGSGCDDPAKGAVYVYSLTEFGWWWPTPVATFRNPARDRNSYFGTQVAVSGGTAVVGSWGFDGRRGRAYVYTTGDNGVWDTTPTQVLSDPTGAVQDAFGISLGLSGSTAIIGAPEADPNGIIEGLAYLEQVYPSPPPSPSSPQHQPPPPSPSL
jgi:hypothetical protein